jgi:hypothetical protein
MHPENRGGNGTKSAFLCVPLGATCSASVNRALAEPVAPNDEFICFSEDEEIEVF